MKKAGCKCLLTFSIRRMTILNSIERMASHLDLTLKDKQFSRRKLAIIQTGCFQQSNPSFMSSKSRLICQRMVITTFLKSLCLSNKSLPRFCQNKKNQYFCLFDQNIALLEKWELFQKNDMNFCCYLFNVVQCKNILQKINC